MPSSSVSRVTKAEAKYQTRTQELKAKSQKKLDKKLAKVTVAHNAKWGVLEKGMKDSFVNPALGENSWERAKIRMAVFAHKDKILKFAAAAGIGAGVATGIYIAVGLIKVAAVGAFFASPAGHGVAIGLGVGAGLVGLFFLGKYIRNKIRNGAAQQLYKAEKETLQSMEAAPISYQPQQQSTYSPGGFVAKPTQYDSNNPFTSWVQTPPAVG